MVSKEAARSHSISCHRYSNGIPTQLPDTAEMAGAVARLREARQLLLDDKYAPALGEARKALEPVRLSTRTAFRSARAKTDPHQRNLDERFAMLTEEIFSLLSGAAHDDPVTKDFEYTREDAVTLTAATAGLVKRHIASLTSYVAPAPLTAAAALRRDFQDVAVSHPDGG
jgi:hypothetical protein